jgi:glycosyltransferase involved in cell wall biosynthesis
MNAIVTFSDAKCIFGQRTIRISNGVDFDSIPIHQPHIAADGSIHFIGVAEVHLWHGYDRLIAGIGEYYKHASNPKDVYFHIVGGVHPHDMEEGTAYYPAFREIIKQYQIEKRIIFHGTLFGQELDEVFNKCQFAIGSLARHRSGITVIKTLKNREYATRGLPFIYSEQDSDFDQQPYVIKAPASEAPIDVEEIIKFLDTFKMTPSEIRQTASRLSWKIQMEHVVKEVFKQN